MPEPPEMSDIPDELIETLKIKYSFIFGKENCCLCKCSTELYSLLIVGSLKSAIFIALPFVFSRSYTSLAGVLKMPSVSNAF